MNKASEKIIGKVINDLVVNKKISRDELFVITKGGFTGSGYAYSGHENNKIKHSINPGFIKHSYETSYSNLQLETIDLYLLHNPELALQHHNRTDFYELLLENFIFLENEVFKGRIKGYGIATWEGLICKPHNLPFIQLSKVLELVQIAANGKKHHFIGIELPINIHAHKAFTLKNQFYKGEYLTALEFAALHDIRIFSSASILYGKDTQDIDIYFNTDEALTVPQKSLYFVKSLPQVSCAIVNLRQENHVQAAIDVNNYNDLPMEKITFTINQSTFRRPQIILK
ncbi:hypothetical protein EBU71_19000 [bacterium]|nr:hypothetical protein [Candidatus Elulimicrobium humile]